MRILIVLYLFRIALSLTSFSYDSSSLNSPGLQVDSTGQVFVTANNRLYHLNAQLEKRESVLLAAEVIDRGLSLSADNSQVVVCLSDLSCSVFNAYNISAGPIRTVSNAFASAEFGVAMLIAGETFYTGSVTGVAGNDRMVLQQHGEGFVRSSDLNDFIRGGDFTYNSGSFSRAFYGGFEKNGFVYFFVFDYNPIDQRSFRLLRVCNTPDCGGASSCGVNSLYEGSFTCGPNTVSNRVRVCGLSLMEDFGGMAGTVAIVSRCEVSSTRNSVCFINVTAANEVMDDKFVSCSTASGSSVEEVDTAWSTPSLCSNTFQVFDQAETCNISSPLGVTLPSTFRVATGPNTITASVAVKVDTFSYVFVGTSSFGGINSILGYDVTVDGSIAFSPFYSLSVNSTIHQLAWQQGQDYITAATIDNVFQVAIECSYYTDCVSCTSDLSLECGWCVVENKCSEQLQCQNSTLTTTVRWVQNSTQCLNADISPNHYVQDPQALTQTFTVTFDSTSPPLPLPGETFSCYIADREGRFPPIVVPVLEVIPRNVFNCSIEGTLPYYQEFKTVFTVSFVSSLFNTSFDISREVVTSYRCSESLSCSDCLQENSPCGWCNLNKVCRGSSSSCRSDSFYLQLSGSVYSDLCPLIDQPLTGDYTQPVGLDIGLITRNLNPPVDGFNYSCLINGIRLRAQYENKNSIICLVAADLPILPGNVGNASVVASVIWSGNGVDYELDSIFDQTLVTLYDCQKVANDCSSCTRTRAETSFLCGWCISGSCEAPGQCSNTYLTTEDACETLISNIEFRPVSGPVEGGTAITIIYRTISQMMLNDSTILLGEAPCVPFNTIFGIDRIIIFCETTHFSTPGNKSFTRIGSREVFNDAPRHFTAVNPTITSINPTSGITTGGTLVTVRGASLHVGNQGDTTVSFQSKEANIACIIQSIKANEIQCVTGAANLSSSALVEVTIDNARLSDPSLTFSFLEPRVTSVFPANTIPSGGITLTFTGVNFDVIITQPALTIRLFSTTVRALCTIRDNSNIQCLTPFLSMFRGSSLDYSLLLAGTAPPVSSNQLPIAIVPDPTNFRLGTLQEITIGSNVTIIILGDNLDSILAAEITVTVGGEMCRNTSLFMADEIRCNAPSHPPGGNLKAEIRVMIGTNINISLSDNLIYTPVSSPQPPLEIIVAPVIVGLAVVLLFVLLVICAIVCFVKKGRKKLPESQKSTFEMNADKNECDSLSLEKH